MSRLLVLARHGESTLDAQDRFSGRSDPPLTEQGRAQAHALASSLVLRGGEVFDHAVTSPLQAAEQTLRIVIGRIGCHSTIEHAEELDERDYGDLTGMTRLEATAKFGATDVERKAHADHRLKGDPLVGTMRRFKDGIFAQLGGDRCILVVSYDDNLRILEALIDEVTRRREPWRTGMALVYYFDASRKVTSKDVMQAASW